MRTLHYAALLLALAGCATSKPPATSGPPPPPKDLAEYWAAAPVDSLAPAQAGLATPAPATATAPPAAVERPGLVRRLLGKPAKPRQPYVVSTPAGAQVVLPSKLKNSQVIIQQGAGNTTGSQASLGKSKAPTQQATDSSSLVANTGSGQQQSQQGNGNSQQATQANAEAPGPLATLLGKLGGPVGYALGAVVVAGAIWAAWYFWYWVPARRKKENQPPAQA